MECLRVEMETHTWMLLTDTRMSVGDKLGSRTRPENVMYTTFPSEQVTAATTLTTVLTSRSLTENPTLNGAAVSVFSRVNAAPRTSR